MLATKNLIHESAIKKYIKYAGTHNYILAFARNGYVWAVEILNADMLFIKSITSIEMRSGGWVLRYKPNKAQQEYIFAHASRVEILCTIEYLEAEKVNHNNNRGDTVEDLTTITWNGVQPANRATCFTECGDFRANEIEYQVKYGARTGGATFTTEKTMNNIIKRATK